jgi:hypothetical protein
MEQFSSGQRNMENANRRTALGMLQMKQQDLMALVVEINLTIIRMDLITTVNTCTLFLSKLVLKLQRKFNELKVIDCRCWSLVLPAPQPALRYSIGLRPISPWRSTGRTFIAFFVSSN